MRFVTGYGTNDSMPIQQASAPTALRANGFDDGYRVFIGWGTESNHSDVVYADGATYAFDRDVTLVAVWKLPGDPMNIVAKLEGPTSASVTFQAAPNRDGTPAGATRSYTVDLLRNGPNGYRNQTVTGPGTYSFAIHPGHRFMFSVGIVSSNEIVAPQAIVTFDSNSGGSATGAMVSQSGVARVMTGDPTTTLSQNSFTRSGHTFRGWATTPTGPTGYADMASYPFRADATLYAVWRCLPLSVTVSGQRLGADRAGVNFNAAVSESPWVSFTATNTAGAQSATVSQSSNSGTITVSGLAKNTGYRFQVTGTNAAGCSYTSAATNRVEQWKKK